MPEPVGRRHWFIAAAFLPLLVLPGLYGADPEGAAHAWLRFERDAILHGELWRLLTAHWLHHGALHFSMNSIALVMTVWLAAAVMPVTAALLWLLLSSLGVAAGLLLFNPDLHWYVGLSGALHGLLVLVCARYLQRGDALGGWLLSLLCVKLCLEQAGLSFTDDGLLAVPVVVDAHLYGALSGLLLFLMMSRAGPRRSDVPAAQVQPQ